MITPNNLTQRRKGAKEDKEKEKDARPGLATWLLSFPSLLSSFAPLRLCVRSFCAFEALYFFSATS
jgi:hypothetical protein